MKINNLLSIYTDEGRESFMNLFHISAAAGMLSPSAPVSKWMVEADSVLDLWHLVFSISASLIGQCMLYWFGWWG